MNFTQLPPEIYSKVLKNADYQTVSKARRTCFHMNEFIKRRGLHRVDAYTAHIEKRENCAETVARIDMGYPIVGGQFVHNEGTIDQVKGNYIRDMPQIYEALCSLIKSASRIDIYGVPVNAQLLECLSDHRIDTRKSKLILTNCVISMNIPEAMLFFNNDKFEGVELSDCRLYDSLMCDEVLSVMMQNNTKVELQIKNIIGRYVTITDKLVESIMASPYMSTCRLDMRRLQTNITFSKIRELILKFTTLSSFYNAFFDFGHLNYEERHAVREGIEELQRNEKTSVFTDNSRERYVTVRVFDVSQVNATTSCPEANFTFFVRHA